jgi:hypothetical protein
LPDRFFSSLWGFLPMTEELLVEAFLACEGVLLLAVALLVLVAAACIGASISILGSRRGLYKSNSSSSVATAYICTSN